MSVRVAIVENDVEFRDVVVQMLDEDARFEVVGVAEDAAGAVELVERHDPDLILLDVHMPRGGGQQAARDIRALEGRGPVLVALSAATAASAVTGMLAAGATSYLTKGEVGQRLPEILACIAAGAVVLVVPGAGELLRGWASDASGMPAHAVS